MEKLNDMEIAILGNSINTKLFSCYECENVIVKIFDIMNSSGNLLEKQLQTILNVDLIFICLPVLINKKKKIDISGIELIVRKIQFFPNHPPIVISSPVPPGTCERLEVSFMPILIFNDGKLNEYILKEKFRNTDIWYIGGNNDNVNNLIIKLINYCYNSGVIISKEYKLGNSKDYEMLRYVYSSYICTKISFCNEIHELCEKLNINWEIVCDGLGLDSKIGLSNSVISNNYNEKGFTDFFIKNLHNIFLDNKIYNNVILGSLITNSEVKGEFDLRI